jgi:hypothetical protein
MIRKALVYAARAAMLALFLGLLLYFTLESAGAKGAY